jgi:hypothetical protein
MSVFCYDTKINLPGFSVSVCVADNFLYVLSLLWNIQLRICAKTGLGSIAVHNVLERQTEAYF